MIEDELIKIWQSSPRVEQVKFEKSRLILDLQSSLRGLGRLAKYGILIEQIAVIIIVPVFLYYIYRVPPLLSKIASLWIVTWSIWYMFLLRKIKRDKPKEQDQNYLDYLNQWKTYLEQNKKLTGSAIYWYILPPITGCILFALGFYLGDIIRFGRFAANIGIFLITAIITHFYFKWIIRTVYNPRLEKINELIKVMEE
ncbi:hypothetical protein [Ulvibacterium sp.]|uniref:hypothetical protein n=1 Tax=Ulvibacterium sp. TaxID=2665914 RepID=UPI003BA988A2